MSLSKYRSWTSLGLSLRSNPLRRSSENEFLWDATTCHSTCRAAWRRMKRDQPPMYAALLSQLAYLTALVTFGVTVYHSLRLSVFSVCVKQVEPFFVTLSLFDIQSSRKISADFHVDLNHPSVRAMVPGSGAQIINGTPDAAQHTTNGLPESALQYPRQVESIITHAHIHMTVIPPPTQNFQSLKQLFLCKY